MPDEKVDESRRKFLKIVAIGSAVVTLGGFTLTLPYLILPKIGLNSFPTLTLVDSNGNPIKASTIPVNSPTITLFNYPLLNEPNFLLNLGKQVPGGVGPNNSIVAYSAICQHLGCVPPSIKFYPPGSPPIGGLTSYIKCNCHGSVYDPANNGKVVMAPAAYSLPMCILSYDPTTDTLQATKMSGPVIFGHGTLGSNNINDDLTGGSPPTNNNTIVSTLG